MKTTVGQVIKRTAAMALFAYLAVIMAFAPKAIPAFARLSKRAFRWAESM